MTRKTKEQLRIDLLNAFYEAYKDGVDESEVDEAVEYARQTAKEDANY